MKDFETKLKAYLEERGWSTLRPADVAKSIMIEGAELLETFQWDNLSHEEIKENPEKMTKIKKELADVMIYCFDMAVILDLDMEQLLNEKLEKAKEKYPAHLFKNKTNDPGSEDVYWKIKEQYRREGKN
jgi:NTP pyrophosphatase (non-canonical NTP hydrolase)